MNIVVSPGIAGAALGEVLTAWPVAPGAMLLLGWHRGAMPAEGVVQLERRRADRGPFRCLSWQLDAEDGLSGFLAAVRLPPATTAAPGQQMTLIEGDQAGMMLRLPDRFIGPEGFANAAAEQGGRHGVALARFLLHAFPPAAMQRLPEVGAMLARLLARVATTEGCIEIMGAVPDACTFLQGWGRKLAASAEAVLVGATVSRCEAQVATFDRPDIMAPATGIVLVLPATVQAALPALDAVFLVTAKAIIQRNVVERRILSPVDSLGHVRDIVGSLTCAPSTADCLRRALRPPYEGRATLEEQPHPVRAAIDLAMVVPGAGAFVSGWLFDPLGVVDAVHLRGGGGTAQRLDEGWTRVQRPDVTEAMRGALPACAADQHGFAIFVTARLGEGEFYLDIGFRDGTCGFLPVPARPCDDAAAQERALEITDLHKPSGIEIIERHLGPLFQQLRRRPRAALPGSPRPDPRPHAIVVALDGQCVLPRAFLSQFLHDTLDAGEKLVFVCDVAWAGASLDALRRLLAFHDLDALVLRSATALTATLALDLAMAATQATDFLLLSPDAVHGEPGWRAALRVAASHRTAPAVACPTLFYEDRSFRFAGNSTVRKLATAPYLQVDHHLAGLPAGASDAAAPDTDWDAQPASIGSLACCLVPAEVLTAIGGAQQGMSTPQTEERAFFLRLQRAGIRCLWVPQAQVHAPDSFAPTPAHAAVGTLVDNWGLRALVTSEA